MCDYFAACENYPNGMVEHPVLDRVPTCTRCAEKMEQELLSFTFEEAGLILDWLEANDQRTFAALAAKAQDERSRVDPQDLYSEFGEWMVHILRHDNEEVLSG